jgi:hypothetical protein
MNYVEHDCMMTDETFMIATGGQNCEFKILFENMIHSLTLEG